MTCYGSAVRTVRPVGTPVASGDDLNSPLPSARSEVERRYFTSDPVPQTTAPHPPGGQPDVSHTVPIKPEGRDAEVVLDKPLQESAGLSEGEPMGVRPPSVAHPDGTPGVVVPARPRRRGIREMLAAREKGPAGLDHRERRLYALVLKTLLPGVQEVGKSLPTQQKLALIELVNSLPRDAVNLTEQPEFLNLVTFLRDNVPTAEWKRVGRAVSPNCPDDPLKERARVKRWIKFSSLERISAWVSHYLGRDFDGAG